MPLPNDPVPVHHYARAGTFRVTLTVYSAGCDGSQVQRGTASMTWSWAPPENAPPSP